MPWTAPFTAVTGNVILASDWNTSGRDDLLYLKDRVDSPPGCRVTHNATQSLTSGTPTALAMNTEADDTGGMHDTVTNNSRITIPSGQAGRYLFTSSIEFAANATGQRSAIHQFDGVTQLGGATYDAAAAGVTRLAVATLLVLNAAQYCEVLASQSSGGALNVSASPLFSAQRVA